MEVELNKLELKLVEHIHPEKKKEVKKEELIIKPASIKNYGSSQYIDGVFSVNNKSYNWRSGFRTTDQFIENPGDYFEWIADGKHICGITRFPLKDENWENTEYAFYFLNDINYRIYINSKKINAGKAPDNEKLRIKINKNQKIEWEIIYKNGQAVTVFESETKVSGKYYLYSSLPIGTKISGIIIVKIDYKEISDD